MKRFPEKRVLVTGAGSGFGKALSIDFAKMGWKVAVAEINKERAQETAELVKKNGGDPMIIVLDVTKPKDLDKAAAKVQNIWGGLDILINNAGVAAGGYMEKIPLEKWSWIIDINLKGLIHGCRSFIPMMEKQGGGYIVNVASNAGIASLPEMSSYNITKAGAISLSETLRLELAPWNIGVSVVCPTFFKTNLMDQFSAPDERQVKLCQGFFNKSKCTAEKISKHTIQSIRKNNFYIITQADGKFMWRMKRYFPELYFKVGSFIYKKNVIEKYLGL